MVRYAPPPPSVQHAFFLDVDGTLIELAETPKGVHVDSSLHKLIAALHHASGGALALVSGRALVDLEGLLGMPRLPMAGQQGVERRDATGHVWRNEALAEPMIRIKTALQSTLQSHPGLLIEDKGLSLALHYRQAPQLASYAHRLMSKLAEGTGRDFEIQKGKRVVEIKSAQADKGTAVAAYMAESPFQGRCPVFVGDDHNDEVAFDEVNRRGGISIKVGKGQSCANYRLRSVMDVRHWLRTALEGHK